MSRHRVDITNRQQAEESLRRANDDLHREVRKFEAVVSSVPDFIFTFDLEGRFTYLNKPLLGLWQTTLQDAVGRTFQDLDKESPVAAKLERQIRQVIETRMPVRDEMAFNGDGAYDYILVPILGAEGTVEAVAGTTRDISARKHAEERLRSSEERYRLIFESANDFAVLTMDPSGVITSWNPGATKNFGYTAAEVLGQSFSRLSTDEDSAALQDELALAIRQGAVECDRWRLRKDGTKFWGSGVLMPMAGNGGPAGFLKILRDTTAEHRAMEDRLLIEEERARLFAAEQHARREAEAANEAKDQFLAMLSHELRTPLAPIHMTLYTLEQEKRLSALGRESLAIIRRSVEMEVRLIDDLLDVSRIVHGKLDLKMAPMDINECVRRAIEICAEDVAAAGLDLAAELDASPAEVVGDASRLQQVFWNLLRNAAKFTPRGGNITVRSRSIRLPDGRAGVRVDVADTGIGIDAAILPKVFNAFEQGALDLTRRLSGLGLGLAIAGGIIRTHGGVITAASDGLDRGAVFSVEMAVLK